MWTHRLGRLKFTGCAHRTGFKTIDNFRISEWILIFGCLLDIFNNLLEEWIRLIFKSNIFEQIKFFLYARIRIYNILKSRLCLCANIARPSILHLNLAGFRILYFDSSTVCLITFFHFFHRGQTFRPVL